MKDPAEEEEKIVSALKGLFGTTPAPTPIDAATDTPAQKAERLLHFVESAGALQDQHYFDFSDLREVAQFLAAKRICLYFADPRPIVEYWNGEECNQRKLEEQCAQVLQERLIASNEERYFQPQKDDGAFLFLREHPFDLETPHLFVLGYGKGFLAIDSETPPDEALKSIIKIMSWRLQVINLELQLSLASRTDPLTGLWERSSFAEFAGYQIKVAIAMKQNLSMGLVNIDRLISVNDTLGIAYGNCLIREAGAILRSELPEEILCARYSGDGFGILGPGYSGSELGNILDRIRLSFARPRLIGSDLCEPTTLEATYSAGIAELTEDVCTYEGLLSKAEAAMHNAKRSGRNQVSQ